MYWIILKLMLPSYSQITMTLLALSNFYHLNTSYDYSFSMHTCLTRTYSSRFLGSIWITWPSKKTNGKNRLSRSVLQETVIIQPHGMKPEEPLNMSPACQSWLFTLGWSNHSDFKNFGCTVRLVYQYCPMEEV